MRAKDFRDSCGALSDLPARVSWVRPEDLHVTLRFFGNIDRALLDSMAENLRAEVAPVAQTSARVRGVGAFPNFRRPSVLWAGVEEGAPILPTLAGIAERIARGAGLPPENRPFVSHVTLGRVRREGNARDLERVLSEERGFDAGAFTIEAVSLFSSELTPQGARYTRLHRLTLDGLSRARSL